MPSEPTRLIDRDLKFLVSETAQERALFYNRENNARKRLHWTLGSIVAVFIGGWLSGSPIASIEDRALTTNAGLLSSEDLFVRSATSYLSDQTERFFAARPEPEVSKVFDAVQSSDPAVELLRDLDIATANSSGNRDVSRDAAVANVTKPKAIETVIESISTSALPEPVEEPLPDFHKQSVVLNVERDQTDRSQNKSAETLATATLSETSSDTIENTETGNAENALAAETKAEKQIEPAETLTLAFAAPLSNFSGYFPNSSDQNIDQLSNQTPKHSAHSFLATANASVFEEPAKQLVQELSVEPATPSKQTPSLSNQNSLKPQTPLQILEEVIEEAAQSETESVSITASKTAAESVEQEIAPIEIAAIAAPETLPEPLKTQALSENAPAKPDAKTTAIKETKEDDWLLVKVRKGDTLGRIFQRMGFSAKDAIDISKLKSTKKSLRIKAGDRLWFKRDEQNENQLDTLKLLKNKAEFLLVKKQDDNYDVTAEARDIEIIHKHVFGRIRSSLYSAGRKAGLPERLILEMVSIYRWNIDFAKDLQPGDHFTVIYEEKFAEGEKVGVGEILAVEFVNQGNELRAIRHEDENGVASYYTPDGHSLRRAFLRNPLPFSRVTSKFSKRRFHPTLKKWRAHKGVDYGAGRGTPIMATADGRVIHKGKKGGYGHTIILQHGNKYRTLYAHMSRYAKSIKNGSKVKQGQTIGYVGATGYATGPHLHYEFRINGTHRDPLTVKLPRSLPIEKKYRAEYLQYAGVWDARLTAVSGVNVAKSN